MPEQNPMMAVGDTISIDIPDKNGTLTGQIDLLGSAAGVTVVLEVSANDGANYVAAKLQDPVTKSDVANLTTDGQIGWCECVGYTNARLRVTAFTTPDQGVRGRLSFRAN